MGFCTCPAGHGSSGTDLARLARLRELPETVVRAVAQHPLGGEQLLVDLAVGLERSSFGTLRTGRRALVEIFGARGKAVLRVATDSTEQETAEAVSRLDAAGALEAFGALSDDFRDIDELYSVALAVTS